MQPFLDEHCFVGSPSHAERGITASFVGQATFNGCIAFTNWPRPHVERLLPPELRLAANVSSAPSLHPLAFIFGENTDGATIFGGVTLPLGVRYFEFALAIPFVQHVSHSPLQVYIPRMYSGYFPATWNGNLHYGFGKETATMYWDGPVFVIMTEAGALLLRAAVDATARWFPGRSCTLPNFAAMQAVFSLPVLGRKSNGTYVRSHFGWGFDDAQVRSADACISIDAPLVAGLPRRRCEAVAGGTFEVRGLVWRLTGPTPWGP